MVVPVALRARELGWCEPLVLGLTTAGAVARRAGLNTVGFRDFVQAEDAPWLARGARMAAELPMQVVDTEESAAYLGMSFGDLVADRGTAQAELDWQALGRNAFLPSEFLQRVLRAVQPQLVCATNSPRAERAAIMGARVLKIPAVCMVDLFAIDERRWIGRSGFADRVCVFNDAVKRTLVEMERDPEEVIVTGNPAFDRLYAPVETRVVATLRQRLGDGSRRVLLWASHVEPASHPWRTGRGDPSLPGRVLAALIDYVIRRPEWVLAVRPHPSEADPVLPDRANVILAGQDWPLTPLLHACDAVCTLTSTVGLEAHLLGKPVVQVSGSIFEDAVPYVAMDIAVGATLETLDRVLDDLPGGNFRGVQHKVSSTDEVVQVLRDLVS